MGFGKGKKIYDTGHIGGYIRYVVYILYLRYLQYTHFRSPGE